MMRHMVTSPSIAAVIDITDVVPMAFIFSKLRLVDHFALHLIRHVVLSLVSVDSTCHEHEMRQRKDQLRTI